MTTGLLGAAGFSMNQVSYDLARLRTNGLITRGPRQEPLPAHRRRTAVSIFYTKVHDRLLRSQLAADHPPAPLILRNALHTIDIHTKETIDRARLLPKTA